MRVKLDGIVRADKGLRGLAEAASDLRGFWRALGARLADEAQQRWPLRRRTGKLRRSLTWAGNRLGRGGVYESSPDALRFGSAIFYSRFHQDGTKRHAARPLIHLDEAQHAAQLATWLQRRAASSGLEVEVDASN